MNWEVLLHWMTHLGGGSWESFKGAVASLAPQDTDLDSLVVRLRLHLSDMGHADFFVDSSRRWRIRCPTLAGLVSVPNAAVLCGGRTPQLMEELKEAAGGLGCSVISEDAGDGPRIVRLLGAPTALSRTASAVGIGFVRDYASLLLQEALPIYERLESAIEDTVPPNWTVKSFDLGSMSLRDGLSRYSACECSPRRGLPRWYVHVRHGRLRPMPKREAIYTAAMFRRFALLKYDFDALRLTAPAKAPPPETYCRVACMCSGQSSRLERGLIVFNDVPVAVAATLSVALGQSCPGINMASEIAKGWR